jgi:NADPH:quinone reductase-like Zn-dependent oxidoreductase
MFKLLLGHLVVSLLGGTSFSSLLSPLSHFSLLTSLTPLFSPRTHNVTYRATIINGQISSNHKVLITGIGGGVALLSMQICIAKGAHVYVTSGSEEKIERAVKMGAKDGVSYRLREFLSLFGEVLTDV